MNAYVQLRTEPVVAIRVRKLGLRVNWRTIEWMALIWENWGAHILRDALLVVRCSDSSTNGTHSEAVPWSVRKR